MEKIVSNTYLLKWGSSKIGAVNSVSTNVGAAAFTRTPYGAHSQARGPGQLIQSAFAGAIRRPQWQSYPPSILVKNCDGAHRGAGTLADLERQGDEGETLSHEPVQVAQVFNVGDGAFGAHRMARVGLVVPHVRAGGIHPEIDRPLIDNVLGGLPVQTRVVCHVDGLPVVAVIVGRVERDRIARVDVQAMLFELGLDLFPPELGLERNVANVDAHPRGDTFLQGQLIHGLRVGVAGEVAHRVDVGRAVVTEQNATGLIGEISAQLASGLLVGQMGPDYGFQVAGIDRHPGINLLRQVDDFALKHFSPPFP